MSKKETAYTVINNGEMPMHVLCFALFGKSVEQVASELQQGIIQLERLSDEKDL